MAGFKNRRGINFAKCSICIACLCLKYCVCISFSIIVFEFGCILFDHWTPLKTSASTDVVSPGKGRSNF